MSNIVKKLYLNTPYYLIVGKREPMYGHQVLNFIEEPTIEYWKDGKTIVSVRGNTTKGFVNYARNRFHTIELIKRGVPEDKDGLLPYFADVTEDLPGYSTKLGVQPKTYHNCQLMGEKKGGNLYFYHHPTKTKLLIALNSNSFELIKK